LYTDFMGNMEKRAVLKWFSVKLSEIRGVRVHKSLWGTQNNKERDWLEMRQSLFTKYTVRFT